MLTVIAANNKKNKDLESIKFNFWMALKHKIKHNLLTQIFSIQSRAKDFQSICKTGDQF